MTLIPLGFWAASGAGGLSYWIATLGGSAEETASSIAIDSSDNPHVFGFTTSSGQGGFDFILAKYDTAGSIQWQRTLGAADDENGHSVAIDSSNNLYAFGYTTSAGAGSRDFLLAKYNSFGTLQWQVVLGGSGADFGRSVAIDSADNPYVFGWQNSAGAGSYDFLLAKYNSSGTLQWQRILGGTGAEIGYSVAIDSSNNPYVLGYTTSTGEGSSDFLLAKYNSSGTIQWQRVLGGTGAEEGQSIAFDSSDNVYVCGFTDSEGTNRDSVFLAKYNSSGTVQWQRILGGSDTEEGYSVAIDSLDNVYAFGITSSAGEGIDDCLIAKYNSSGTIQWQRVLGSSGFEEGVSIAFDSLDNIYVLGETSAGADGDNFLFAKLPNDGSLTGTYELDGVNFVYAASTLTAATSTLTAATSSLTAATSTLTGATSTLTGATPTFTTNLVEL